MPEFEEHFRASQERIDVSTYIDDAARLSQMMERLSAMLSDIAVHGALEEQQKAAAAVDELISQLTGVQGKLKSSIQTTSNKNRDRLDE